MKISVFTEDISSRRLEDLTPRMTELARNFLVGCKEAGVDILIYCTYRSLLAQAKIYSQGRSNESIQAHANQLREKGWTACGDILASVRTTRGPRITYAGPGESAHQFGYAFDYVPTLGGKPQWDDHAKLWNIAEGVAKEVGLQKLSFERPHLQDPTFEENKIKLAESIPSSLVYLSHPDVPGGPAR